MLHALNSSRPFLCTLVTSIMMSHLLICIPCTWNQMHVDCKSCRNKGTSTAKVMWHDLGIRPLVAHYSKYSSTTKKKSSASGLVWSQFLQKRHNMQWEVGWMQFIVLGKEPVFSYFCVYCKSAVQTAMLFRVQTRCACTKWSPKLNVRRQWKSITQKILGLEMIVRRN